MSDEPFRFNHKFTFIWHTTWLNPCPKCQRLNGRAWTSQSLYQHVLWDEIEGDLWDLDNDIPLTHPNCKCVLEVQYTASLEELLNLEGSEFEAFQIMTSNIRDMKRELDDFDKDLQRVQSRVENTRTQMRTYLILLNNMGLPPEAEKVISLLTRTEITAQQTIRAMYLLQAATLAGGPMAWGIALATTGVALLGYTGIVMDLGGK